MTSYHTKKLWLDGIRDVAIIASVILQSGIVYFLVILND